EFEKIKVSKVGNESNKKVILEQNIKPTITKVFDTYYHLDEPMEETFNNTKFNSDEMQKNVLEVLLKKVVTKCNTLYIEIELGGKININKNRKKNNKEKVENIKVLMEKKKLDRAYKAWVKKKKWKQTIIKHLTVTKSNAKVIRTEDIKKEDKGAKLIIELSMTYPKLAKIDYANRILDPEDC
ncbi:23309_t:CDS:2, partial [Gigaspora margarita]